MIQVDVEHLGVVEFEVKARKHTISCDQPTENGGLDKAMTPPELLLAALGTCAGYYAVEYLKKYNLPNEGTRVRVTADKEKGPARLDNFRIEVEVGTELSEQHRDGVERSVHHCLIHNTLLNPPKIALEIKSLTETAK
jgi:putative redox protein